MTMTSGGDWLVLHELLERGDPEFVDRLRNIADADALGAFAERWYVNPSPNARRLLLAYLERPLNAYRHEALVKRLFKRAEAAGDDAVMARFLVAFDRSIRRVLRARRRGTRESGAWPEHYLTPPGGTTMPRGKLVTYQLWVGTIQAPDWIGKLELNPRQYGNAAEPPEPARTKLEGFRLFSVNTRHYLRRRAWRYFRRLGKDHPERYVAAISEALVLYEDADVATGLALIDNWGLVHALFHHSPVLESRPRGWIPAAGRSLAELEPAPIYDELWRSAPRALFDLLARAGCRPVRQWAARMLRRDLAAVRTAIGVEDVLSLLARDDPEVVEFAVEWLRDSEGLAMVGAERWLAVAETASPAAMEVLAEIMARQIASERIALGDAARLAAGRPLPLARLGLGWLKAKSPNTDEERQSLLALLEA
ncbi:MAG TPA: hypothetical protein VFF52_18525, partial [Isosphaeraceae bacterium]|nr:hypothetical protein [Isosphaeraceae bacterium]